MKSMKPKVLVFTVSAAIATAATVVLFALRGAYPDRAVFLPLAVTALTFAYHLDMRLLVGVLILPLTPRFDPRARWFRPRAGELRLYRFLRVRFWRSRVPTFRPALFDPAQRSWAEIARNMCCAEVVHTVIAVLSYVPLLFIIPFGEPVVFLVTSVLSSLLDVGFIMVQRTNRPALLRLLDRVEQRK